MLKELHLAVTSEWTSLNLSSSLKNNSLMEPLCSVKTKTTRL